jgi:formate--tetrahydrofolate ligase
MDVVLRQPNGPRHALCKAPRLVTAHSTLSLEVAQAARLRPITDVADELGVPAALIDPFGRWKAKVQLAALEGRRPRGRLVLVTAMTPTPDGEGKTTVTIGLAEALRRIGTRAVAALRQPSLGPVLGIKGGGTGGGRAQVVPMEDINVHFTGDLAAIGAANNLLAALVDNEVHHGASRRPDPRRVLWRRCVDMNDRALRRVVVGAGDDGARDDAFDITAASEVMAVLSLAHDRADLKRRLARLLVGFDVDGEPLTAGDLRATGAMAVLLRDALLPNLVQTLEGGPALVHGGPFANIAHGASSLIATRLALAYADVAVTEAGFGSDLGAEKFFDIVCRAGDIWPRAVVLVATCRALKWHGGVAHEALSRPDVAGLERGLDNLAAHVDNIRTFGIDPVVAINRFASDTEDELGVVEAFCEARGLACARADAFNRGGAGCEALARDVMSATERGPVTPRFLYPLEASPAEKVRTIARRLYGADDVSFVGSTSADLELVHRLGMDALPVCIAKTQASLSDDPSKRGRPHGYTLSIRQIRPAAGAGFLVAYSGTVTTMPGLPREPAALAFDLDDGGVVHGLY